MKFLAKIYHKFTAWINRHIFTMLFAAFIIGGGFIVLFPRIVIKIPAGSVGVIYRPLSDGVDLTQIYGEGLHILFPLNSMTQYSIAVNVKKIELDVLTSDLLKSRVTVSFQYSVNQISLPLLHRYVGTDYLDKLILPEITAATRAVFGKFTSNQAFTSDLTKVVKDISISADNSVMQKLSPPGLEEVRLVRITSFQLETIEFPDGVQKAIANKMIESSNAEAMAFKIDAAKQEVTRLAIEAEGIKQFQDIVNPGMTEKYLRYKGIEATQKLAESNNSKVIVFGSSPSGLPLILGGEESIGSKK